MEKVKILFVCVHNSARSQMAESIFNSLGHEDFLAESAGFDPKNINPFAIEVMKEIGIDISQNKSKDIFDLYKQGKIYHYLITVCDETAKERCPIFPGLQNKITWSFKNPADFTGTQEEKLNKTREVRDQIKEHIYSFLSQAVETSKSA